jgi:hypothetical protein
MQHSARGRFDGPQIQRAQSRRVAMFGSRYKRAGEGQQARRRRNKLRPEDPQARATPTRKRIRTNPRREQINPVQQHPSPGKVMTPHYPDLLIPHPQRDCANGMSFLIRFLRVRDEMALSEALADRRRVQTVVPVPCVTRVTPPRAPLYFGPRVPSNWSRRICLNRRMTACACAFIF